VKGGRAIATATSRPVFLGSSSAATASAVGALEEINPYAAIRKRQRLAEAAAERQRLEVVATHRKVAAVRDDESSGKGISRRKTS
jgi:hypothetical protein